MDWASLLIAGAILSAHRRSEPKQLAEVSSGSQWVTSLFNPGHCLWLLPAEAGHVVDGASLNHVLEQQSAALPSPLPAVGTGFCKPGDQLWQFTTGTPSLSPHRGPPLLREKGSHDSAPTLPWIRSCFISVAMCLLALPPLLCRWQLPPLTGHRVLIVLS